MIAISLVGLQTDLSMKKSPLVTMGMGDTVLCGMCCLVSGPKEGYMYDVLTRTKLLSCYEYTCDTLSVSVCHSLLHAITRQGLETYTVRTYSSASECVREQLKEQSVLNVQRQKEAKKSENKASLDKDQSDIHEKEECSTNALTQEPGRSLDETANHGAAVEMGTESNVVDAGPKQVAETGSCSTGKLGNTCSVSEEDATASGLVSGADNHRTSSGGTGPGTVPSPDSLQDKRKDAKRIQSDTTDKPNTSLEYKHSVGNTGNCAKLAVVAGSTENTKEEEIVGTSGAFMDAVHLGIKDPLASRNQTPADPAVDSSYSSGHDLDINTSNAAAKNCFQEKGFPLPVYDVEWLKQV